MPRDSMFLFPAAMRTVFGVMGRRRSFWWSLSALAYGLSSGSLKSSFSSLGLCFLGKKHALLDVGAWLILCVFPSVHPSIHTSMHACMHTNIQTYIQTYKNSHIKTYKQTNKHTYIHTSIHAYIHTYIHIYIWFTYINYIYIWFTYIYIYVLFTYIYILYIMIQGEETVAIRARCSGPSSNQGDLVLWFCSVIMLSCLGLANNPC